MLDEILLALVLLATLLGSLVQIHVGGLGLEVIDLAIGIVVLVGGIASYKSGALQKALKQPTLRFLGLFIFIIALSWILSVPAIAYSGVATVVSLLYALRLIAYLFCGIIFISLFKPE